MELYVNLNSREDIEISKFVIEAKVIGRVEACKTRKLSIYSDLEALNIKYHIFNNLKLYFLYSKLKWKKSSNK